VEADAVQCGFCTPGQLMAAMALLRDHPRPSGTQITEAMSGNLCRCGTYPKVARAIRAAARRGKRR
jgi:isoquinoline 1-oxidoreductase alpha subunit